MRGLLDFAKVLTFLVALGAFLWAAFGVVSQGVIPPDQPKDLSFAIGGARVGAVALVLYLIAALLRKRMD
ncbi:MAG: hypothetical protein AAGA87_11990 [Pseudomonadota bacterium]